YKVSLAVYARPDDDRPIPLDKLKIRPTRGRFHVDDPAPPTVVAAYCYGFSSSIGAGPYDRRLGRADFNTPDPQTSRSGGGNLGSLPTSGTVTIGDSL